MSVTAIRTVVLYIAITASMRLMGKRQLGQMHPAELVVALLIADLAVIPMQDVDLPLIQGLLPIAVLVTLELLLSVCELKWPAFARFFSGSPVQVIRDGKLLPHQLKRLRMPLEDLCEQLRDQNVFDVTQVHSALIESSGRLSILLKPAQQAASYGMLQGEKPDPAPFLPILADGTPVKWAMQLCNLTQAEIDGILDKEKVSAQQVLLLLADETGRYTLLRRRDAE